MPVCSACKKEAECRMSTEEGAYGPWDTQTCKECHEANIARARAENKRFGMRCKLPKAWEKLTAQGLYSEVR